MRKKGNNIKSVVLLVAAMTVAATTLAQAPVNSGRQQLVVTIVVDQLRSDYLDLLRNRFGSGGFNRLMRDAAYIENVRFDIPNADIANTTAMIFTGAYPNVNGIPAALVYNTKTHRQEFILNDPTKIGNFTSETYSPTAIKVSTIADELRIDNELGAVHSIAGDAQQAIIMAGHAANSAFWISDLTGNWASSTYYKLVPPTISSRNYNMPLPTRMDTMSWKPSMPLESYYDLPSYKRYYPFRYTYPASSRDRYRNFKKSALANEEITQVAMNYLKSLALGRHSGCTDMLNIGYTLAPYKHGTDDDCRVELQDTYMRLDGQLSRLFAAIDGSVGLKNTLVVLTSTGYFDDNSVPDEKYNIPTGEFYPERAKSLLNMYLMAIYGNGNWIDAYYNKAFFLNRKLIKEKNLNLSEVRAKASEFLRQMSGVTAAYSLEEILNNPSSEEVQRQHRAMVPSLGGDVTIEVNPGWKIMENDGGKTGKERVVRANAVCAPAFIMATNVVPQKISIPVEATIITPTVARILRVRSPNAAKELPLSLK